MFKCVAVAITAALLFALAGCGYEYEEAATATSSHVASSKNEYVPSLQELLQPHGAVSWTTPGKPLPPTGPCSYVDAVVSHTDVEHRFPTMSFAGNFSGLKMIRVESGFVVFYAAYTFDLLKWETPEAQGKSARVIRITESSFENLVERDRHLKTLLEQIYKMGPYVQAPYYLVDSACLSNAQS